MNASVTGPPASAAGGLIERGATALEAAGGVALQFVTFRIAEEEYGVDIMDVREIKAWAGATRLPNSAEYMRGVINLRGVIVPVYDLRARFGLGLTDATATHVVIIIAVGQKIVGVLVDAVSDILDVQEGGVQAVPRMDTTIDAAFLSGLVNVEERMVALLDTHKLFAEGEIPDQETLSAIETDAAD